MESKEQSLQQAHQSHQKILYLKKQATLHFIELGKAFDESMEHGFYKLLGHETFEDYIESPDISLGRRSVYMLLNVYRVFVKELACPMESISEIHYSKLDRIVPLIRVQPVSHRRWIQMAKSLSRKQLEEKVRMELSHLKGHSNLSRQQSEIEALKERFQNRVSELEPYSLDDMVELAQDFNREKGVIQRAARIRRLEESPTESSPLISQQAFSVIYGDPPWKYGSPGSLGSPENHYPTMETEAICSLPVPDLCRPDCILFLWGTSPMLRHAFQVIDAWGFQYKTSAVWDKELMGLGNYFRIQHEYLLVATKGQIPAPLPQARPRSVIRETRREHSRKPDQVYEFIEAMYPELSKIELFARQTRPGWVSWGNQVTYFLK